MSTESRTEAAAFDGRDYFTSAAIAGLMADSLAQANPAAFDFCARAVDMAPAANLRGIAYLLHLLAQDNEGDPPTKAAALEAVADHAALMAVWLEMQARSETANLVHGMRAATRQRAGILDG